MLTLGVELHEMRAEQDSSATGFGSGVGSSSLGSGDAAGGSKSGTSRASLHSKAVIIDSRLAVIGSMNLDLRSQLKNSEVALVIRSTALSREATRLIETSFDNDSYKLELAGDKLYWRAPPGARYKDTTSEPEASARLKLLVNLIGPFAPDEML